MRSGDQRPRITASEQGVKAVSIDEFVNALLARRSA